MLSLCVVPSSSTFKWHLINYVALNKLSQFFFCSFRFIATGAVVKVSFLENVSDIL